MERKSKMKILAVTDSVIFQTVEEFIARRKFEVLRMVEPDKYMHPGVVRELDMITRNYINRPADPQLSWDNDKVYSSELVWKVYLQILMLQEISITSNMVDLKWSKPAAKRYLNEHFKGQIPSKQVLIFPDAIYNSQLLEIVYK